MTLSVITRTLTNSGTMKPTVSTKIPWHLARSPRREPGQFPWCYRPFLPEVVINAFEQRQSFHVETDWSSAVWKGRSLIAASDQSAGSFLTVS